MFICHSVTPAAAAECIQDGLNEILRAPFQPLLYGKCGITNYVNICFFLIDSLYIYKFNLKICCILMDIINLITI